MAILCYFYSGWLNQTGLVYGILLELWGCMAGVLRTGHGIESLTESKGGIVGLIK